MAAVSPAGGLQAARGVSRGISGAATAGLCTVCHTIPPVCRSPCCLPLPSTLPSTFHPLSLARWDKKFKPYTQEYAKNEEKVRGGEGRKNAEGPAHSRQLLHAMARCLSWCPPFFFFGASALWRPLHPTPPTPHPPPCTLQFFSDFASAFAKLLELGVPFPEGSQPV